MSPSLRSMVELYPIDMSTFCEGTGMARRIICEETTKEADGLIYCSFKNRRLFSRPQLPLP